MTRLSRTAIRQLLPGQKLTLRGITVECLAGGNLRYSVQAMVDGQRLHKVIGLASAGATLPQAEAFLEKAKTEASEGRLRLPRGRKLPLRFATAAARYIAVLEASGGKNLRAKRCHLRDHLVPFFADSPLSGISEFDLRRYAKQRQAAGAAVSTTNRELTTVSHLFTIGLEQGWLSSRPCKVHRLPGEKQRIVALSKEEKQALLQAAIADYDPDTFLFTLIGLMVGLRHSEIMRVRFSDIDFDNYRLNVPVGKTGARVAMLTPSLCQVLRREQVMRDDQSGWLFPARPGGKGPHRARMQKAFRRVVEAARLDPKRIVPHAMRHTLCTDLAQSGADIATIMRISGHRSYAVVLKYIHICDQHIDRAMATLDDLPNYPGITQAAAAPATRLLQTPRQTIASPGISSPGRRDTAVKVR
jgi:integrase